MILLLHRRPSRHPCDSHPAPKTTTKPLRSHKTAAWRVIALVTVVVFPAPGCLDPTSVSPYPNRDQVDFDIRSVSVQQGAQDQALDSPLVIFFTDRVAAAGLNSKNIALSRGGGAGPAMRLRQDMVRCSVTVQPVVDLEPGSVYELRVSEDLESWSGARLDKDFSVSFTTGNHLEGSPPKNRVTNESVQEQVFDRHCGCCHDPKTGAYAHILALEADSLVGRKSRSNPNLFLVVPGSHEESYLLHKVLGLPGIDGEPMPPPDLACGASWPRTRMCSDDDADMALLADWIFDLGRQNSRSTP